MLPKRIVITMMSKVDQELLGRVDEFRFSGRYPSRSAAARALMEMGYKVAMAQMKKQGIMLKGVE